MSFSIGGISLGHTFDAIKDLERLEQAGYTHANAVYMAEGEDFPPGAQQAAEDLLQTNPDLPLRTLSVLRALAGR